MTHSPVGFRPRPAELRAINRAQVELGVNRSDLFRAAMRDWLTEQQLKGTLSLGTATAFQ